MVEEMEALHTNGTWDLVPLPPGKSFIGCCWVYTVKVGLDGQVNCLKAHLVAKGYVLRNMVRTIMIPSLQWPRLLMFTCFSLWLICALDLCNSWISRISSFMVIL